MKLLTGLKELFTTRARSKRTIVLPCRHGGFTFIVATFDHAPVTDDSHAPGLAHTSLVVVGCPKCKETKIFPESNYDLTTEQFKIDLDDTLIAQGWLPIRQRRP